MQFFISGRQTGKTTRALEWMRQAPEGVKRICVVPTMQEAMRLLRENAYTYDADGQIAGPGDLETWQFVALEEVQNHKLHGMHGLVGLELCLDNLNLMIQNLLGTPYEVKLITATGELVR